MAGVDGLGGIRPAQDQPRTDAGGVLETGQRNRLRHRRCGESRRPTATPCSCRYRASALRLSGCDRTSRRGGQPRRRFGRAVHHQSARALLFAATPPGDDEHHRQFPLRNPYPNTSDRSMAERPDDATMGRLGLPGYREGLPSNPGISRSLDASGEAQRRGHRRREIQGGLTDGPNRHRKFQLRSGQLRPG